MINEKVYQGIYEELANFLPSNWETLIVYLEYGQASYTFSFYVKEKGQYVKCYDLPGVSEDALAGAFKKLDQLLSKERKTENELWTNMTMVVEKSGEMHADLDYTDLLECAYQFRKNWKKKYLI